jgi:hypothetical protein
VRPGKRKSYYGKNDYGFIKCVFDIHICSIQFLKLQTGVFDEMIQDLTALLRLVRGN